jgi:hypothetical protein
MKTQRLFLMVALTLFLVTGKTGAQHVRQLKATEYFEIVISCNREYEVIAGDFEVHLMIRITKDYYLAWAKEKYITGEAVSQTTGEIFRINYLRKSDPFLPGTVSHRTFHINMVGNQGTHFIAAITLEYEWTDEGFNTKLIRLKEKCL